MKRFAPSIILLCLLLVSDNIFCQSEIEGDSLQQADKKIKNTLFQNDTIIPFVLNGNIRELFNDRSEEPAYHNMKLIFQKETGVWDTSDIEMRTRGHFRKLNCTYPPLLINFKDDNPFTRKFGKTGKLKLVMPCKDESYVIREWLVYKLYNIITPYSLQAILVQLKMNDTKKGKSYPAMNGILLENEKQMAERNQQKIINQKKNPELVEQQNFLRMAVFQYLIGNTDWSIQYLQNIILMAADSTSKPLAVAYDFDHSGMVSAPYAYPAEDLKMSSVVERRYRGYCITDLTVYRPVIEEYNLHKTKIYSLYNNCKLIDSKYKNFIVKYLDDFYKTINNPALFKKEFLYPCDKNGTGNVIIKGLRKE